MLEFVIKRDGCMPERIGSNRDVFCRQMLEGWPARHGVFSCVIKRRFLWNDLHILAVRTLNGAMLPVLHWIKTEIKADYDIMQFDPERKVIITNFVGTFGEVCHYRKTMAHFGCDDDSLVLPATPYFAPNGYGIPDTLVVPKYRKENCQTHPAAIKWYNDLLAWFDSEQYRKIFKLVSLRQGLSEGRIDDMAADPKFIV